MKKVMVALKGRNEVLRLTATAVALADPAAEVEVTHIAEVGQGRSFAEADATLTAALELLRAHGLEARGDLEVTAVRSVPDRLAERARESGAEAVVIGSRGLGHLSALLRGSVSHALLARLDVPVVAVPESARLPLRGFRRVLVALRAEEETTAAVAALGLLRPPPEFLTFHAPHRVAVHAGHGGEAGFAELPETSPVVLARALERMREAGIDAEARSLEGHGVARALDEIAKEWDADLVVLGSRRLLDWQALVAGSTAHDVLHRVDLPVLITAGRAG